MDLTRPTHPEVPTDKAIQIAAEILDQQPDWKPFPLEAMPRVPRDYIQAVAAGLNVDPAMVGVPLIAVLGGIAGTKVRLNMDPRAAKPWVVRTIFWTATVANSGSTKTPAWEAADDLAQVVERELRAGNVSAKEKYERDLQDWKDEESSSRGPKPKEPHLRRLVVDDATVEGIGILLDSNPSGLLLSTDELRNWVDTFARYRKSGGGSDASRWLPFHGGKRFVVDRKGGDKNSIYIPHAAVSVTGTIQPGILGRIIGDEERESGFFARMLLSMPPSKPRAWKPSDPMAIEAKQARALAEELAMKLHTRADQEVTLSPDAQAAFMVWQHQWAFNSYFLGNPDIVAFRTKLEEYSLRFTLLYWLIDHAWENTLPTEVDARYVQAGIATAEWFHSESLRVLGCLSRVGGEAQKIYQQILVWITEKCRAGAPLEAGFAAKDLYRSRLVKDATEAAQMIVEMEKAGVIVEVIEKKKTGRPAKRYLPAVRQNARSADDNANTDNTET